MIITLFNALADNDTLQKTTTHVAMHKKKNCDENLQLRPTLSSVCRQ